MFNGWIWVFGQKHSTIKNEVTIFLTKFYPLKFRNYESFGLCWIDKFGYLVKRTTMTILSSLKNYIALLKMH